MNNAFASALIACYRLHKAHQTKGSRELYDAVNDAFVYEALARHGSVVVDICAQFGERS